MTLKALLNRSVLLAPLFLGCEVFGQEVQGNATSIEGGQAIYEKIAVTPRKMLGPSAPIEIQSKVPSAVMVGEAVSVELIITSPLQSGELEISVSESTGLALINSGPWRIDLSAAERPIKLTLDLQPLQGGSLLLKMFLFLQGESGQYPKAFAVPIEAVP